MVIVSGFNYFFGEIRRKRVILYVTLCVIGLGYCSFAESQIYDHNQFYTLRSRLRSYSSAAQWEAVRTWSRGEFNPHKWLLSADILFLRIMKGGSGSHARSKEEIGIATRLLKKLPSKSAYDIARYLHKGILAVTQGNRNKAQNYFDITKRTKREPLIRAMAYVYLGELTYLSAKLPNDEPAILEKSHYYFQKALDSLPVKAVAPLAYAGIARRYFFLERWDKVVDLLKQAIRLDPEYITPRINLGLVYVAQHKWSRAYVHLYKAYQYRPEDVVVMKELILSAYYLKKDGLVKKLVSTYLKHPDVTAEAARPVVHQVLFKEIEQIYSSGHVKQALNAYLKLVHQFPTLDEIRLRIGMCYRTLNQYAEARVYFQAYVQKYSANPVGFFELGLLDFYERRYEWAAQNFIRALELNPRDAGNVWLWTVKALLQLQLYREAYFVLAQADKTPHLDIHYREIIRTQMEVMGKKYKLSSTQLGHLTFSRIRQGIQQVASKTLENSSKL